MLIITQLWHIRQATNKGGAGRLRPLPGRGVSPHFPFFPSERQGSKGRQPLCGAWGAPTFSFSPSGCSIEKNKRSAINGRQTELRISASAQHEKSTSILSRPTGTRRVVERRRGNSSF